MIEPLASHHIEIIAHLHFNYLTGLLQQLGPGAIKAFYRGAIASPYAIGFVDAGNATVNGFVFGTAHSGRLKQEILRHRLIATIGATLPGVLRRPSTLTSLCASVLSRQQHYNTLEVELTYLAVDERQRTRGIGRQLVENFSQALRERDIPAYELSVDADNHDAIDFYHRLGFFPISRYKEFGILRNRYRMEIE